MCLLAVVTTSLISVRTVVTRRVSHETVLQALIPLFVPLEVSDHFFFLDEHSRIAVKTMEVLSARTKRITIILHCLALFCTALQTSRHEWSLRRTCSSNLCTGLIRIPDSYWISSRNASNRHWSALSTRYLHYRRQRWTKPLVIPLWRYWGPKRSRKLRLSEIQIWWSSAPTDSKTVLIFRYLQKKK